MTILGRFTAQDGGYAGALQTLSLSADLRITPSGREGEKAPSHLVLAGERECGAAWPSADDGAVLYVKLDDPAWAEPVRARLVRGPDEAFLLVWRRPPPD